MSYLNGFLFLHFILFIQLNLIYLNCKMKFCRFCNLLYNNPMGLLTCSFASQKLNVGIFIFI